MSSIDIRAVLNELNIEGMRVDKIYHYPPNEFRIKLRGKGRVDVLVEAGKRFHATEFPKESPRFPSAVAMLLRKHLEGAKVERVYQHDFDRIVVVEFSRGGEKKIIVSELFGKGNLLLLDEDFKVILSVNPSYKIGDVYSFPEKRLTPFDVKSVKDLEEILDEKEVVKTLATKLGLGGLYAEEILERAGVNKKKPGNELEKDEVRRIFEEMRRIFEDVENCNFNPQIILKGGEYIDFQPIDLKKYEGYEKKYFESFNKAVDEFYTRSALKEIEAKERKSEVIEKLENRLKIQLETKEKYEKESEKLRRIGDLIYEKYPFVEKIHSVLKKAVELRGFDEVKKILAEQKKAGKLKEIIDIIPKEKAVVLSIDDVEVKLFLDKSLHENAEYYYDQAKRLKEKVSGIVKAIEKTKEEIRRAEEIEARRILSEFRVVRKREWYEKYRWYVTSEGFLVIGGRNAEMNEEIVSKHFESKDLFFHTQTPGGAVTILKKGLEAGERSIREAAEFAAIYSALWKHGMHSGEVYYVTYEQVKRAAKPGEYLPKGSFYIIGKRNYLSVELKAAVGVDLENLRVIGGPVEGVRKHADYYVVIGIGDKDVNEISVEIAKIFYEKCKEEEKHLVRAIATPDEIAKFLPPGKSRIIEVRA